MKLKRIKDTNRWQVLRDGKEVGEVSRQSGGTSLIWMLTVEKKAKLSKEEIKGVTRLIDEIETPKKTKS